MRAKTMLASRLAYLVAQGIPLPATKSDSVCAGRYDPARHRRAITIVHLETAMVVPHG